MPKNLLRLLVAILLWLNLLAVVVESEGGLNRVQAESFANPAFQKVWNLTDKLVADGITTRSFLWGPEPFANLTERYDQSPKHSRLVQYFDKGRMELTSPDADPNSAWFVSSGLLVRDLVGGVVQVGDNTVILYDPAEIPVAGDSAVELNKNAPTYADFSTEAFGKGTYSKVGTKVLDTIKAGGGKDTRDANATPSVEYAYYAPQSAHNIAAPFWQYFQQRGPVASPKGGTVIAPLFDWQYLMGYPITEAYWTTVKIGGKDIETLVQLFERRVLTYTPSNPDGLQVEMGNVGRHYYQWRYTPTSAIVQNAPVPESEASTVYPKSGGLSAIFHITSIGYFPGETISYTVTRPTGEILTEFQPVQANQAGTVNINLSPPLVADSPAQALGLYTVNLSSDQSRRSAKAYFRIALIAPRTPTTPYTVDSSVPDSVNAIPVPAYGPLFTDFLTLIKGFYEKDFAENRVSAWITDPFGQVFDAGSSGAELINETLDGVIIHLGSPPEPGVWAITIQDISNPSKKSITYVRVTEAPPELTIGAALNILTSRSTSGLFKWVIGDR